MKALSAPPRGGADRHSRCIVDILLTLLAAAAGGILFLVLHIPGSLMVGSMLATIAFQILTGHGALPPGASPVVQILLGAYIGNMLHRDDMRKLKTLWRPALILLIGLTAYAIGMGFFFSRVSGCDILTALYATAPGGMVEVCLFAGDTGGNISLIAAFHTLRTTVLYLAVPIMATMILKKRQKDTGEAVYVHHEAPKESRKVLAEKTLFTLGAAAVGGLIGMNSGVPAGTLLFSILGAGAAAIFTGKTYVPRWFKRTAQILSGAVVGMRCDAKDFLYIKSMLPSVLAVILGYLLMTVLLGSFLHRRGYVDLPTGIFSCCAGGVGDVTLVASDYDVDITKVVLLHLVRYLSIFVTYPILGAILT